MRNNGGGGSCAKRQQPARPDAASRRSAFPAIPAEQFERQQRRQNSNCAELWNLLDAVKDPEIPALSLWDLGVLRDIQREADKVNVVITPTYSGCPAMAAMREDIGSVLEANNIRNYTITTVLAPAWSTDWLTDKARQNLHNYGIAPPAATAAAIQCPHCGSAQVKAVSEFGSTACKALYQCQSCYEPFDYFKTL